MSTKLQKHFNVTLESLKEDELIVSQEGLLGAIKAALFGKDAPATPAEKEKSESMVEELGLKEMQVIERYLNNASLINKLVLKEGDIDGRWISSRLEGDKTDADKIIARCLQHATAATSICQSAIKDTEKLIKFAHDTSDTLVDVPDSQHWDIVHAAVTKIGAKNLNPVKISPQQHQQLLASTEIAWRDHYQTWVFVDEEVVEESRHLPALTKEQIGKIGKSIPELRRKLEALDKIRDQIPDKKLWGPYEGDRKKLQALAEAIWRSDEPEEWLFSVKLVDNYGWLTVLWILSWTLEQAIEALLAWIYHSIQAESASMESLSDAFDKGGIDRLQRRVVHSRAK